MKELQEFLEAIDYRITEGYNYLWTNCYPNSHSVGMITDDISAFVVFSLDDQTVFEVTVMSENEEEFYYRYIMPEKLEMVKKEYSDRNLIFEQVFDDRNFEDVDTFDEILKIIKNKMNACL